MVEADLSGKVIEGYRIIELIGHKICKSVIIISYILFYRARNICDNL